LRVTIFGDIFERHLNVVRQFGRFPHRNELLGRTSTPAEVVFLDDPRFRFDLPVQRTPTGEITFGPKAHHPSGLLGHDASDTNLVSDLPVDCSETLALAAWFDGMALQPSLPAKKRQSMLQRALHAGNISDEDWTRLQKMNQMYNDVKQQPQFADHPDLLMHDLYRVLQYPSSRVVVVDIRHDYERRVSTIAHAISVAEYRRRAELGELDDFIVVTCCTIGVRSLKFVAKELQNMDDMGVTPAYELTNLRYGLLSWIHAGYPVVDPSGQPVKRFHYFRDRLAALVPTTYEAVQTQT